MTNHSIHGDSGQAAPLLAVALVLLATIGLGLVHLATAAGQRSLAQATADAVALAGAADGEEAARRVAEANQSIVVSYRQEGVEVEVTVERGGVRASARARWEPGEPVPRATPAVHLRPATSDLGQVPGIPYTARRVQLPRRRRPRRGQGRPRSSQGRARGRGHPDGSTGPEATAATGRRSKPRAVEPGASPR